MLGPSSGSVAAWGNSKGCAGASAELPVEFLPRSRDLLCARGLGARQERRYACQAGCERLHAYVTLGVHGHKCKRISGAISCRLRAVIVPHGGNEELCYCWGACKEQGKGR